MRRGKEIAQGSHASLAFLTRRIQHASYKLNREIRPAIYRKNESITIDVSKIELLWMSESFKKVCVTVDTEDELKNLYGTAKQLGLEAHLITDSGKTEFNGVPTITALAIGPDEDEIIDSVTGDLPLY